MEKKRIITLGIAGLSLLLAASITSTVAWYTGSTYLAITDINIKLKDPNLRISIDNVNFVNELSDQDLNRSEHFTAVSTMFSDQWLKEKAEKPTFKEGYPIGVDYVLNNPTDYANANSGYFSQVFYLKSDIDAYITFDRENTTFLPDEAGNQEMLRNEGFMNTMRQKYPGLSETQLKEVVLANLNNAVKSMRFSILVLDNPEDNTDDNVYQYYIYDPYKEQDTYLGGILDTSDSGYYNTYNHKEVLYGEVTSGKDNPLDCDGVVVYDDPLLQSTSVFQRKDMTCFNANNAAGDMKFNRSLSEANGLSIKKEKSLNYSEVENKLLIPIKSSNTRKIVLSFYQEGWDLDNTNLIVYSQFYINVSFMVAPINPWA